MISGLELRFVSELRMTGGRTLYGVACPFNRPADIGRGAFREVVRPGAFSQCLATGTDVSALADHRGDALLGRTRSGSLKLTETAIGLEYTLDVAPTAAGDDICRLAERAELAGCSIGFTIPTGGETWDTPKSRTLTNVSLHHVAIITGGDPSYSETTTNLRHQTPHRSAKDLLRHRWVAML